MPSDCHRKALDLLALRAHFRRELEAKLRKRGFEEAEIDGCLERLASEGWLDDHAAAIAFAEGPLRRKGYGPRRMLAELSRRGADESAAEDAVRAAFPDGDIEAALQAAVAWRARRREDRKALARHLERKGFSGAAIHAALRAPD